MKEIGLKLKLNLLGFWYGLVSAAVVLCSILLTTMLVKFRKMKS